MIAVPSPVNLCALTIIPPASLYMTLAHEYAVKCSKGAQSRTQTPSPNPKPQTRTQTRTPTQTRSPNRPHRIGSALGMGAEGSSAGGKGGMNPSKGEGSIPRCSLYNTLCIPKTKERPLRFETCHLRRPMHTHLDTFTCGRHHGERGGKFYVAIMRTADYAFQMGRSLR